MPPTPVFAHALKSTPTTADGNQGKGTALRQHTAIGYPGHWVTVAEQVSQYKYINIPGIWPHVVPQLGCPGG